ANGFVLCGSNVGVHTSVPKQIPGSHPPPPPTIVPQDGKIRREVLVVVLDVVLVVLDDDVVVAPGTSVAQSTSEEGVGPDAAKYPGTSFRTVGGVKSAQFLTVPVVRRTPTVPSEVASARPTPRPLILIPRPARRTTTLRLVGPSGAAAL